MKKIIIIEDVFKEFERIKSIIDGVYICPQQYTKNDFDSGVQGSFINKLTNSLKITCTTKEEYEEQEKIKKELQTELKNYCDENDEPVYLIDYKLDGSGKTSIINGIRFKDTFLDEMYPDKIIPVLFITSVNYDDKLNVEDYVKKTNDKTICDYQTKPNSNGWNRVQDSVRHFIDNAQLKPRKQIVNNDQPKNGIPDEEAKKI